MTTHSAKKDSVCSSTFQERLPSGNTVENVNDGDEVLLPGRLQRTLSGTHAPDRTPGAFSIPGLRSRVTTTTPESSVSGGSDDVTIRNMEEAEPTIVALAVDEEDERQRIQRIREVARLEGREEGIQEALRDVVEATDAKLEPSGDESSKGRRCRWPLTFLSAGVVFVVAIVVTVYFLIRNDPNPPAPGSTAPPSATVSTTIAPTKDPAIAPVSTTMPSTEAPTVWPTATPTGSLRLKQLGLPIYGSDLYHYYGSAVDINGNGIMIAIGADADNIGEEGELCLAEVHRFSESLEKWVRVGSSILAPRNFSSLSITSVFLSNDGRRLLLFAGGSLVHIYNLLEDDWVLSVALTASNITTRGAGQIAAIEKVQMSADGSRMVMILERESSPEYPIVHAFDTTDGLPIGAPIYGSEARGIAVSSDATVVSVYGSSNTTVYRFDGFYFNEMGSPLPGGLRNYDQVVMSGVGDLVVITHPTVQMYQYDDSVEADWKLLDANLTVNEEKFRYGTVVMSEGATTVGIIGRYGVFNPSTALFVFRYNGANWVALDSVDHDTDELVCSFSSDGTHVICGEMYFGPDFNGDDVGKGTVYQLEPSF